jgi:hypothetical protein
MEEITLKNWVHNFNISVIGVGEQVGIGTTYWTRTKNGKRQFHREDGPAKILLDGTEEWWIDGKRCK